MSKALHLENLQSKVSCLKFYANIFYKYLQNDKQFYLKDIRPQKMLILDNDCKKSFVCVTAKSGRWA